MPGFQITFIRSRCRINRYASGQTADLLNLGYEEYEGVEPLALHATTIEAARVEARDVVRGLVGPERQPEGYWIVEDNRAVVETIILGQSSDILS